MSFHLDPQTRHAGTSTGDVTLTSSEIATALVPALVGMVLVACVALLMLM